MPIHIQSKCLALLSILFSTRIAYAFDFNFGPPTQCDNFNISWSGGSPPFQLLLIPAFNVPQNISIPPSAYNETSQKGSYNTQLTFPAGRRFLVSMSDADGFGTRRTSELLTTGPPSITGSSCDTNGPTADFYFQLNTALQQCRPYTFDGYSGAHQPVTIRGYIPLGQTFDLHPPQGRSTFDWVANVAAGTSIVFVMTDASGRRGGSSDVNTVGWSDDSTCLNYTSPSSTASQSSVTAVATTTTTVQVSSGARVPAGAVAGAVIGAVIFTALVFLLALYLTRRLKRQRADSPNSPEPAFIGQRRPTLMPSRRRRTDPIDLLHRFENDDYPPSSSSAALPPRAEYEPNPFIMPSDASALHGHTAIGHTGSDVSRSDSGHRSPTSAGDGARLPRQSMLTGTSEAARRKAAMAGVTSHPVTPRFVLHTDLDDAASVREQEIVELPPRYTDRGTRPVRASAPELASPPETVHSIETAHDPETSPPNSETHL